MAIRSGLSAQVGMVAETTYGTPVTVTRFVEFLNESLKLNIERVEGAGIRTGNRVLRTDRWAAGKRSVDGDLELEVTSKGFGLILKHALGGLVIATPGGGTLARTHTATLADTFGTSLTLQVGRTDTAGTVNPFTYSGIKVNEWELSNGPDEVLKLKLALDGYDEAVTTPALASASYAAADELLYFSGATLTVGGSACDATKFSLSGKTGLKTDRHFLRSNTKKKEPIAAELADLSGEIETEFNSLVDYARFTSGTPAAITALWEGSIIEAALKYSLSITLPSCRFDGETPNVSGPDVLTQTLPFKVLNNGTAEPVTIVYQTTDTAA